MRSWIQTLTLLITIILGSFIWQNTFGKPPSTTKMSINLQRSFGQWYEIGSFPVFFQRNYTYPQAFYAARTDGL